MAGGQAIDLASVGTEPTIIELENMHIHKTGALIRASVKLGALSKPDIDLDTLDKLDHYIDDVCFTEHNPRLGDGLSALLSALSDPASNDGNTIQYRIIHRLLAEGNFVLSVSEGALNGVHSSFYDLYRVAHGKLVEHWDKLRHAVIGRKITASSDA